MPVLLIVAAALLAAPAATDARVTRVEIERVESPTFEGRSFGDVGPYEKLVGRVHGEVDPASPDNAVIADIDRAPRNARGMVEYSADLLILRPVDRSRVNGRLFFEVNNRGRLLSLNRLNEAAAVANDPTAAADAGNGFLMRPGLHVRVGRLGRDGVARRRAPEHHVARGGQPGRLAHRGPRARGAGHRQCHDHGRPPRTPRPRSTRRRPS